MALRSRMVDGWLVLRASADLVRIDFDLRRKGYRKIIAELDQRPASESPVVQPRDVRRARRYARRIDLASRFSLGRAQCLHRSLVLHHWLRFEGMPSELQIGVRKDGQQIKAHAWVELRGYPVTDPPQTLVPFARLNDAAARDRLNG